MAQIPASVSRRPSIPTFVSAREQAAFRELFKAGADGKITAQEAKRFAKAHGDLFQAPKPGGEDHRFLTMATRELLQPGSTYARSWTPDAKLTDGARQVFEELRQDLTFWR